MALRVFDIDYDLKMDPDTKDFKELVNEEAVNQSLDLFITTPYRIGIGYTNNLLNILFTDLTQKTKNDVIIEIQESLTDNYQILDWNVIDVDIDYIKRTIYVYIEWSFKDFDLSGKYSRYWSL